MVGFLSPKLRSAALALVVSLILASTNNVEGATTLVDASGSLNKAIPAISTTGIVALLTSPGTTGSLFPSTDGVSVDSTDSGVIISAPGATLESATGTGLSTGNGAAAAGSLAGAVILGGVTLADAEVGLANTRHGRTLAELFASVVRSGKKGAGASLIVAVQTDATGGGIDAEEIKDELDEIFDSVAAAAGSDASLSDYFKVDAVLVKSSEDVSKVSVDICFFAHCMLY